MKRQSLGSIAFGDPTELVGKAAKVRKQSRERWKAQGSKRRKDKQSSKSDFHRKHG